MQSFIDWFIGEAGAAWIAAIIGWFLVIRQWLKRERPSRVIVQEVMRQPLLNIHPLQRKKLSIFYTNTKGDNIQIYNLKEKGFFIYNSGTRDITEKITFSLRLEDHDSDKGVRGFWQLTFNDPKCTWEPILNNKDNVCVGVLIEIPYLNSYSAHDHEIIMKLTSENDIDVSFKDGMGQGWSIRFVPPNESVKIMRQIENFVLTAMALSFVFPIFALAVFMFYTVSNNAETLSDIPLNVISLIVVAMIAMVAGVIIAFLYDRDGKSKSAKLFLLEWGGIRYTYLGDISKPDRERIIERNKLR